MMDRYIVAVWHGEHRSVFYIIDTIAPSNEQPAVILTLPTKTGADEVCAAFNRQGGVND